MNTLSHDYYLNPDVVFLSRDLLGKFLFTNIDGNAVTGGIISETEAYRGSDDKASHAYNNRRTPRTEIMFHQGGVCYVYLCYGIHCLLNIVTNVSGIPHAILIRAIEPIEGIELMKTRRRKQIVDASLTKGPGSVAQSLGIDRSYNGLSLQGPEIWIEDRGIKIANDQIIIGPRIGIDYAGEDAHLPWRFRIKTQIAI